MQEEKGLSNLKQRREGLERERERERSKGIEKESGLSALI